MCQIKDILKGALRFNQSQLEAEENEEISIADDHYTAAAAAAAAQHAAGRRHDDAAAARHAEHCKGQDLDGEGRVSTDEREEEEEEETSSTPPDTQVHVCHSPDRLHTCRLTASYNKPNCLFQTCLFWCLFTG